MNNNTPDTEGEAYGRGYKQGRFDSEMDRLNEGPATPETNYCDSMTPEEREAQSKIKVTYTTSNTPDTEVEIEQNAETGEVITANGVRLTPGTEWTEALQVEVMDGYLHLAEMRHFAKDPVAHMEEMREHWQKLQDFISTLLSSRDTYWKERGCKCDCAQRPHAMECYLRHCPHTPITNKDNLK